jgi:hypothetical protein
MFWNTWKWKERRPPPHTKKVYLQVLIKLFLPRETSRLGTGMSITFFTVYTQKWTIFEIFTDKEL